MKKITLELIQTILSLCFQSSDMMLPLDFPMFNTKQKPFQVFVYYSTTTLSDWKSPNTEVILAINCHVSTTRVLGYFYFVFLHIAMLQSTLCRPLSLTLPPPKSMILNCYTVSNEFIN